jgi:hypothetical protein
MEDTIEMRMARKREFSEFIDWQAEDGWNLASNVLEDLFGGATSKQNLISIRGARINVPIHRLREWNPATTKQLISRPAEYLTGFQLAIKDFAKANEEFSKQVTDDTEIFVGITGDFGHNEVRGMGPNPRPPCPPGGRRGGRHPLARDPHACGRWARGSGRRCCSSWACAAPPSPGWVVVGVWPRAHRHACTPAPAGVPAPAELFVPGQAGQGVWHRHQVQPGEQRRGGSSPAPCAPRGGTPATHAHCLAVALPPHGALKARAPPAPAADARASCIWHADGNTLMPAPAQVRPKIVKSVHFCPSTKEATEQHYRDVTALVGLPTGARLAIAVAMHHGTWAAQPAAAVQLQGSRRHAPAGSASPQHRATRPPSWGTLRPCRLHLPDA